MSAPDLALTNVLFYATLGLAYGGGKIELAGLSETNTHFGWAAGVGLEVGLTPNWSAKAEYLYVDLANKTYLLTGANHGFEFEHPAVRPQLSVLAHVPKRTCVDGKLSA